MTLEERVEILCNSSVIDGDAKEKVIKIIKTFKDKYDLILTEENASMFITHISVALTRIKRKEEEIKKMDDSAYKEVLESAHFQKAEEIYEDLKKIIDMEIPEEEKKYILINICAILENAEERK